MAFPKLSTIRKTLLHTVTRVFQFIGKVLGGIFLLVILPLGGLQLAIERHWLLGIPIILVLGLAVYMGIRDYKEGRLDTFQGIMSLCGMLSITIAIFAFISFVLHKSGAAHYQGFAPQLANETRYVSGTFIGFYIWELFEIIPGVRANQALGFSTPLQRSGFWAGLPVLLFRGVIVFIVLDVFRKWWVARGKSKTPAQTSDPIERWVITGSMVAARSSGSGRTSSNAS